MRRHCTCRAARGQAPRDGVQRVLGARLSIVPAMSGVDAGDRPRLRWRRQAELFLGLLALGLVISTPSHGNAWFGPDLHLIRDYSANELSESWTGNWDPDRIERAGYRPLLTLSNHLRYKLLGESPDANVVLTILVVAVGFTFLAAALRALGVPLWIGAGAAILEFTSKNFTYTYSWATNGYQALHIASFGAAAMLLALAIRRGSGRGPLLAGSVAAWTVTLLLKDPAVILAPVLILLALGADALNKQLRDITSAPSYTGLRRLRGPRGRRAIRTGTLVYASTITAVTIADLTARRIFVPEAPTGPLVPNLPGAQLKRTLSLTGDEFWPYYTGLAGALLIFVLATPRLARALPERGAGGYWITALFALFALACSISFSFVEARSDLVYFPLYFYALFVCCAIAIAVRLWPRPVLPCRVPLVGMVAALLGLVSLTLSVRESVRVQRALAPDSIQSVAATYDLVFGDYSDVTIPAERRRLALRDLRDAGIRGPIPGNDGLTWLYCRVESGDSSLVIPRAFALREDMDTEPGCDGVRSMTLH